MQNLDLTASKWASPDVRRERESQISDWTRRPRGPSPLGQGKAPSLSSLQQPQQQKPLLPTGDSAPLSSSSSSSSSSKPTAASSAAQQRRYLSRQADLQRFRRLFRRLAWKANSLTHWSHRALSLAQEHQHRHAQSNGLPEVGEESGPAGSGPRATLGPYDLMIDPVDAERQFKIDFYEFYALLERGLVCLLGVWGIVITASAAAGAAGAGSPAVAVVHDHERVLNGSLPPPPPPPSSTSSSSGVSRPIIGDSRYFQGATHRFHANVLAALDHPTSPLHTILGTGPVREYIGVAKEFRNKWKDVETRAEDSFRDSHRVEEEWDPAKMKRYETVLRDLKLDELLGNVLRALEEAGRTAEREVERLYAELGGVAGGGRGGAAQESVGGDVDLDMLDAPFEVVDRPAGDLHYEIEMEF